MIGFGKIFDKTHSEKISKKISKITNRKLKKNGNLHKEVLNR